VGTARGLTLAVACAALGCAGAYRPLCDELPALPADAFERASAALQAAYPRLLVADRARFRLASDWTPDERGELPAERRATVWLEPPATLCAVVEVRWLSVDVFGVPGWSAARGDADAERDLLGALRAALQ
jgi:hypothetical protein